ncbi:hydrolase [Cellulomonas chitinilytica]|uniref:Hydrolase n=1 Tax=Cellulomonas chitinilytica TaxID=398759 RepID=A0A919P7G9_9CELL|nr:alpha/beta hydrolase [Cellulomonas chitinilytica]GIG23537.1 hydrolase [Cellulomonas chitinilytica]
MPVPTVSTLAVPGASLYYEVRGSGHVLLLVCGGIYDAAALAPLADALADRWTVVTYDRRGNSRSPLTDGPATQPVDAHVDDAHLLLAAVADERPAAVFGNSSGAQIALGLTAQHPDQVRIVVAHEPPVFGLLDDAPHWQAVLDEVAAVCAADGTDAAMAVFGEAMGRDADDGGPAPDVELPPQVAAMLARFAVNTAYFVEHEVPVFGRWVPDLAALRNDGVRVVPAVGADSAGEPAHRAGQAVADLLGVDALVLPGGHGGFGTHTARFAEGLRQVLS